MQDIKEEVFGGLFSDDDVRSITIDYKGSISSEEKAARVLLSLGYDYGEMTTAEDIIIWHNNHLGKFETNGFDLLCALKRFDKERE